MLRAILALLFAILYLIIGIPVLGIEWIISKFNRKAADISQLRMVQWAFRVILFICGTKVTVIGEENVPKDEAVLYIGNHKSYFDIIITYARCPGLTGYVAKNDMAKVPLLSLWMKRLYCLFINRDDVKEALKTILAGIDHIKNGISMCIFPEGTRNKTDDLMLPFKEGSFKMAEKTGCAIVPMAITGSADILENHFPKVKATHVILEYGKPIYPNELDKETKKKIGAHCQGVIEEMLVKNEKLQKCQTCSRRQRFVGSLLLVKGHNASVPAKNRREDSLEQNARISSLPFLPVPSVSWPRFDTPRGCVRQAADNERTFWCP